MLAASFLGRFLFGQGSRRRALRPRWNGPVSSQSALESRILLAGNVTAELVDGDLRLVGDAAANDIKIIKTTAGTIVQGLNGTTINGATTDFVAFAASLTKTGAIHANLEAGDDKLQLNDLTLDEGLIVHAGAGNDRLGLTGVTIHGGVVFTGQAGNDTVFAENSTIDRSLHALMGAGDDLVALTNTDVTRNLLMVGDEGADRLALDGSSVGGWLFAFMNSGNDDVRLANGTDTKHVRLWGGGGADLVQVNASTTSNSFFARLGRGADVLSLVGAADLGEYVVILGGRGRDSKSLGTATLPDNAFFDSIKSNTVDAAFLTARIDNATTGLLAAVTAARNGFITPVNASLVTTGLIQSSGISVTTTPTVGVTVTGDAGRVIQIDSDGDGFDDGTATLNAQGTATIQVPVTHTDANDGENTILVRQLLNGEAIGATQSLKVHYATGKVVRMATTEGNVDIELFGVDTPGTVTNFLSYLNNYGDSIFHRTARLGSGAPFIIQGGGFDLNTGATPPTLTAITGPTITGEFQAKNSNVRGTLSMAHTGTPNSGSTQWFINTNDNGVGSELGSNNLDAKGHTVFGRVIGTGMTVVDSIQALTTFNIANALNNSAMSSTPLKNYTPFTGNLTGTVTVAVAAGVTTVNGTGTQFNTEIKFEQTTPNDVGTTIQISGKTYTVKEIVSDTVLRVVEVGTPVTTAVQAKVNAAPLANNYVQLNTVTVIANA